MADLKNEQWLKQKYEEVCADNPSGYALVSLKIKRFRIFNRLFGKAAGDILIERVFQAIEGWLKEGEYAAQIYLDYYNILARISGDYDAIFVRIQDLNHCIRDMEDMEEFGKIYSGMGIYLLTQEYVNFDTAQYNADICRADCPEKTFRNSHFEIYGMTYHDLNLRYYDMEQEILPAMEKGDIRLYLQPKVDLRTGEITQAEALVRWIDPEKGIIPVGEFLPGLEKNGLVENVDLYLFEKICQAAARWYEQYGKKIRISANLSKCAFNYRYFFDDYLQVYNANPCPKECIELEFIEGIVLNQVEQLKRVVNKIHDFGFECSLDDFGSGYSSFSVLTSVQLETMKIDRSLFQDETDPREKIVLRHIITTAKELDMKIVAEGVETPGYVKFLRDLDCDYIQGYVFYKPMPIEEFEERFLINGEKVDLDRLENI